MEPKQWLQILFAGKQLLAVVQLVRTRRIPAERWKQERWEGIFVALTNYRQDTWFSLEKLESLHAEAMRICSRPYHWQTQMTKFKKGASFHISSDNR